VRKIVLENEGLFTPLLVERKVSLRWRPPSVEIGFGGEIALTSAHTSALKSCSWPIPFC
jgi:hypothetical protein